MALTKIDDRGLKTPIDLQDNEKIRLGTGNDLEIYHDGTNTYLDNNTGQFNLDAASGNGIRFLVDGVYQCQVYTSGIDLPDNKKLRFGDSEDLQIYHDGSSSNIKDAGTGQINLWSNEVRMINAGGSEYMFRAFEDGACELYHNHDLRLQTWSDGVNIYGDEGESAILHLYADDGDDNADKWKLESNAADNSFYIATYASGSWLSKFSVDTSGKVSVGGESPIYNFNVRGSGQQTLLVGSTDAGGAYVTFDGDSNGDGQSGDYCHIGHTTNGDMELSADNPNGDANIIIRAGNAAEKLRVLSGGGLTFNGDTAAANALDDYEEGTWTPAVTGGIDGGAQYISQYGWYTKVGRLVHASFYFQFVDATTGSQGNGNQATLGGLPFTVVNTTAYTSGGLIQFTGMSMAGTSQIFCYTQNNATGIWLYRDRNVGAAWTTGATDNKGKTMYGTITYATN